MQQVRFHARDDALCPWPGQRYYVGQMPRYVGRESRPATSEAPASQPALRAPVELAFGSVEAQRCVKETRRGNLWAADAETASLCGLAFTEVEYRDGEWRAQAQAQALPIKIKKGEH